MKAGDRFAIEHEGERWHILRSAIHEGAPFAFEIEIAAGGGPPRHAHPEETEVLEVLRGTLHCHLPDGMRTLQAGDRCVIPKGTPHMIRASREGPVLLRASYDGTAFEGLVAQLSPGDKAGFARMARHAVRTGFAGSQLTNPLVRAFLYVVAAIGAVLGIEPRPTPLPAHDEAAAGRRAA